MSCSGGGCAQGLYPDPSNRTSSGRAYMFNNPRSGSGQRRPTYFNRHLYRLSAIIQNPASISLREFAVIVLLAFSLYKAYFFAANVRGLLLDTRVAAMCPRQAVLGCTWNYAQLLWQMLLYGWAADVIPWAFVAAVTVFFAEEAVGFFGRKK